MCSTRGACLACKAAAVGTVEVLLKAQGARGASRRQPWSVPRLRGRPSACDIFQRFGRGSSGLSWLLDSGSGSSPIHRKLSSESTRTYRRAEVEITSSVFATDRIVYASSQLLLQKPARSA